MRTTDEIMELAEDYAGETASDLQFRSGDPDGCRAALRAAVESLVADAERYRWLRDEDEDPLALRSLFCLEDESAANCDAAIDLCIAKARAALKASQP